MPKKSRTSTWEKRIARKPRAKPAKFKAGDVIRYADGSTALMEVKSAYRCAGDWRYCGTQFYGAPVCAYEIHCTPVTEEEKAGWAVRWNCTVDGCTERVRLAGAGARACPTHFRFGKGT